MKPMTQRFWSGGFPTSLIVAMAAMLVAMGVILLVNLNRVGCLVGDPPAIPTPYVLDGVVKASVFNVLGTESELGVEMLDLGYEDQRFLCFRSEGQLSCLNFGPDMCENMINGEVLPCRDFCAAETSFAFRNVNRPGRYQCRNYRQFPPPGVMAH